MLSIQEDLAAVCHELGQRKGMEAPSMFVTPNNAIADIVSGVWRAIPNAPRFFFLLVLMEKVGETFFITR